MDQRGKAGGEDDATEWPSFPLKPGTAGAEPIGLQLGQFVAAAGVTKANRELVAHEFAAPTGEDWGTAGETCPLLLALAGGEPSDEAAIWEYGAADRGAVASGGIAEAVAGKSIQSQEGDGGVSDKIGWRGRGQQFRDSGWSTRDPAPALGPAKENNYALESLNQHTMLGCRNLKRKFRVKSLS